MQRYYVQMRALGHPFVFDIIGRQHFSPTLNSLFRNSDEVYTRPMSSRESIVDASYRPLKSRRPLCNVPVPLRKLVCVDELGLEVKDFAEVIQLCAQLGYMPQRFAEHQLEVWQRGFLHNEWPLSTFELGRKFPGASAIAANEFISQLGG